MTPVMILVMGVKPIIAVGTDLTYNAITKIVGGTAHWRQGTVHRKTAYWLASGSVPATIIGVGIVSQLKKHDPSLVNVFLLRTIAWALILVAIVLALKPWLGRMATRLGLVKSQDWRGELLSMGERHTWMLTGIGAGVGLLVGLTSVGAGTLIIVALLFLYPRWESKDLVGTDVFHAAILVSAAGLAQSVAGNVNLSIMLSLLVGSIPGVLVGSRLAVGFPEALLRFTMAGVLLVSGAKLL